VITKHKSDAVFSESPDGGITWSLSLSQVNCLSEKEKGQDCSWPGGLF